MAIDAFLKFEPEVKGESPVKGFENQLQLLSWSWGMSQTGTTHDGKGGGGGKVNVQDLSISKFVDQSSAPLILALCTGKHYDKVTMTLRKAGGSPLAYLVVELTEVIVTSASMGGSGGEDRQTDSFTLNFAKFSYKYQPQKKDGSKDGGEITATYDIAANAT
jgi:type VI secretion system secreted protein Hcp